VITNELASREVDEVPVVHVGGIREVGAVDLGFVAYAGAFVGVHEEHECEHALLVPG